MAGNMSKLPVNMSLQIQKIKEQIIKTGEELVRSGLVIGTWGNISRRLPEGDQFLITPSGMSYYAIKPADLVVVDLAGEVLDGNKKPATETLLHLAIYKARPDIMAVVHTHSTYASAHSVARAPIPPIIEDMVQVIGGQVDVAQYALPGTAELAANTVTALGDKNAVLLANHGGVGVGVNLVEALKACLLMERSAQIYSYANLIGIPTVLKEEDIKTMREYYLTKYGQR